MEESGKLGSWFLGVAENLQKSPWASSKGPANIYKPIQWLGLSEMCMELNRRGVKVEVV